MMSGSLGSDPRWRKFGGTVARLGVHSVLSLPLVIPDRVVGAMNVYAHGRHVFDERAAELGEDLRGPSRGRGAERAGVGADAAAGGPAAVRFGDARRHRPGDRHHDESERRHRGPALARLRVLSQNEHHKLVVVARQIIDDAVRRAQARPRQRPDLGSEARAVAERLVGVRA